MASDRVTFEVRNARWDDVGGITLELRHPVFGWVPFTAREDDVEALGRDVYQAGAAGAFPVEGEPRGGRDD